MLRVRDSSVVLIKRSAATGSSVTLLNTFSRSWHQLLVFIMSSDWFIGFIKLPVSFVIGQGYNFFYFFQNVQYVFQNVSVYVSSMNDTNMCLTYSTATHY